MELTATWNAIRYGCDQVVDTCALPLNLVSTALDDVNISNTLFKTIQLTTEISTSVLTQMGRVDLIPALLEPVGRAFDGFTGVVTARRWIKDLAFFANNRNFAWANPIGEYPNFLKIGSKVIGFGNDLVEGWKWAAKAKILPELSKTIGEITVFGFETIVVTLADCQDAANLAIGVLDLTDNCRGFVQALLNNRNYLGKSIDVLSSALHVTATVVGRIDDPMFKLASKICRLAGNLIVLARFVIDQTWVLPQRTLPPVLVHPSAPAQSEVSRQEGNSGEPSVEEKQDGPKIQPVTPEEESEDTPEVQDILPGHVEQTDVPEENQ